MRNLLPRWCPSTAFARVGAGLGACAFACGPAGSGERFETIRADLQPAASEPGLVAFGSCEELLAGLQAELIRQVHERADLARLPPRAQVDAAPFDGAASVVRAAPLDAAARFDSAALGRQKSVPAGFSSGAGRVAGVEQSDSIASDGDRLYVIDGQALHVLAAWPADEAGVIASVAIEGAPTQLLVHEGVALVASHISGALPGAPEEQQPPYYSPVYTKLTVVDARVSPPRVVRESFVEGQSFASSRVGSIVRALVQQSYEVQLDAPEISYVDTFGRPRSQAQIDRQVDTWVRITAASVASSSLDDYVPAAFERDGAALVAQPTPCGDYYLSTAGVAGFGTTSVFSLDLADVSAPLGNLTWVGYDGAVVIDEDAAVVRQTYYGSDPAEPDPSSELHLFALDGRSARYRASGSVAGYLPTNLFFDELDGVIRAATSDADGSRFVTLGQQGNRLLELGRTASVGGGAPLAAPTFVAERAYGITVGAAPVLVVADLSDPSAPTLAGALPSEAVTNILVPLPDERLLAVGQVGAAGDERVVVQLFDVRDATAPALAHEYLYSVPGSSAASYETHAVSVSTVAGLFTVPLQRTFGTSSLEVFRSSPGGDFSLLGSIVPEPAAYVARALIRDDTVFAISPASVAAYELDALSGPPIRQVALPSGPF
jgi:beta propeller domain-containing protein